MCIGMSPKKDRPLKPPSNVEDTVSPLGLVDLYYVKYSSRKYYVTLDPKVIGAYRIMQGDILKLKLIEVRKHREHFEEDKRTRQGELGE
jgi:hypothetical protein